MNASPSGRISGKKLKFTWTDGPTKGESHEHVFHPDGSVEFRQLKGEAPGDFKREPRYGAVRAGDDVELVSYLSSSGYTLTVALNFRDNSIVGFASNDKQWFPVKGTFA
jgi:hypothetical protein